MTNPLVLFFVVPAVLLNEALALSLRNALLITNRECANRIRNCGNLVLDLNAFQSRQECEVDAFRKTTLCIEALEIDCALADLEKIREIFLELAELITVRCSVNEGMRLEAEMVQEIRKERNCIGEIRACGLREMTAISPRIPEIECMRHALLTGARCVKNTIDACNLELPNLKQIEEIFLEIVRLADATCKTEDLYRLYIEEDETLRSFLQFPMRSRLLHNRVLPIIPLLPNALEYRRCSTGVRECDDVILKLNPENFGAKCEQIALMEAARCVNVVQQNCKFLIEDLENIKETVQELGRVITAHCQPSENIKLEEAVIEVHNNRSCLNKIRECCELIPIGQVSKNENCEQMVLKEAASCAIKGAQDCDLYHHHDLKEVEAIFIGMVETMTKKCKAETIISPIDEPIVVVERI